MTFINNLDCVCYVNVNLLNDVDLYELKYIIDEKENSLYLSNKGNYVIPLNPLETIVLQDIENIKYDVIKQDSFLLDSINDFKIKTFQTADIYPIIRQRDYLFDDLKEQTGYNLYKIIKRIYSTCLYYKKNKTEELLNDITYSLDYFIKYYNGKENYVGNWWEYEIGIPKLLLEILIMLFNELGITRVIEYSNILNFYCADAKYIFYRRNYPNINRELATYANLADNIYVAALKSILTNDRKQLNDLYYLISNCLDTVNSDDGFYEDGSFIQHKNIAYNGSYGEVLLSSLTKVLTIFVNLKYNCDGYFIKIRKHIVKSFLPFIFDGFIVDSVRGRAASRRHKDGYYSFEIINNCIQELLKMSKSSNYLIHPESTCVFNYMDRFVKKNRQYYISINSNSQYISSYESINGENILGSYSGNFTIDLYFKGLNYKDNFIKQNCLYRIGSTNILKLETENNCKNNQTMGVRSKELINTLYIQNHKIKSYESKIILPNSIVCIGSKISSNEEYISNIYTKFVQDKVRINCSNDYIVETFTEEMDYLSINKTEESHKVLVTGNRYYLKNPSNYSYQLCLNNNIDMYKIVMMTNKHIIQSPDVLFINSFDDEQITYKNITFKGIFSAIITNKNDCYVVEISSGSRSCVKLKFIIAGYTADLDNNEIIIENEMQICKKFTKVNFNNRK